ncbi:PEP/pyruvate-binding domain-containing protein [Kribbella sp. NPDC049174]|uniref:PEP/pyruvate-binding domain-containing protein n=1 Tax=Kribbella sp. NPDC049174 TaxID=3364112 RepID=UPI00371A9BD1
MSRFAGVDEIGKAGYARGCEVVRELSPLGITTPDGFTVTVDAYQEFIRSTSLRPFIAGQLRRYRHGADLLAVGAAIRTAFAYAEMPAGLARAITTAYRELGGDGTPLVVRSGAAPFVDRQEIFFNVRTSRELLAACKRCFAILFAGRAILLREKCGLDQLAAAMFVKVQRMGESELPASGTVEVLDNRSPRLVRVKAIWGLGDPANSAAVNPDEYVILDGLSACTLVARRRGTKETKVVCAGSRGVRTVPTGPDERCRHVLTDVEALVLADWAATMESLYGGRPLTIDWAKDGPAGDLAVVGVRPAPAGWRGIPFSAGVNGTAVPAN